MNRIITTGLVATALVISMAACTKSSDTSTTTTTTSSTDTSAAAASPSSGAMAMNGASASDGAKVYQTNCSSCHQATGAGIEGTFPPLAGNAVVTGDPVKLIHIVKYGLTGKINVAGHPYNGMMPDWAKTISDADTAAALTYIRSSWGNKASAITEAQVKAVSK